MTIRLPADPTGEDYEDLVAVALRLLGYFTETRITLREHSIEVLEADVVATPLGGSHTSSSLFEAKKHGPTFSAIYKLYGHRMYLNISQACLVTLRPASPESAIVFEAMSSKTAVRLCHLPIADLSKLEIVAPPKNALSQDARSCLVPAAWFQQIALRLVQAAFIRQCKSNSNDPLYNKAKGYHLAVESSFFQGTPLARAETLYEAYWRCPNLPGEFVRGIAQKQGVTDRQIWNRLWDTGELPWLQYLVALEHKARLWIVKNALDDVLERGDEPMDTRKVTIAGLTVDWPLHNLPPRFLKGLDLLRKHPFGSKKL